tara:strand:- start:47 stop:826 length:780 start_codon:yes stop_codon:yes gene_type:complete
MKRKVCAIVQARTDSTRLPNKVMLDLQGKPLILFLLERLSRSRYVDEIIVATTSKKKDDVLVKLLIDNNFKVMRGSEEDVLGRFSSVIQDSDMENFARITADCPLIDPQIVDKVIKTYFNTKSDYASNINPPTYPDGLDVEVFSRKALIKADINCKDKKKREHVTPWILESGLFKTANVENSINLSDFRWTVDESEDLDVIRLIIKFFNGQTNFSWKDILKIYKKHPEIYKLNNKYIRNEGEIMTKKEKMKRRSKNKNS